MTLTKPVILLGDTQEHESTGFPLHDNDGAVDEYVEVAQRPPEQPLFGRRVLEWALLSHPEEPVIHMGDLLDVSCESELDRMRKVVPAAGSRTILPGNHDGLMFGIFNYEVFDKLLQRQDERLGSRLPARHRASRRQGPDPRSGAALTKRDYIVAYLAGWPASTIPSVASACRCPSRRTAYSWRNPRSRRRSSRPSRRRYSATRLCALVRGTEAASAAGGRRAAARDDRRARHQPGHRVHRHASTRCAASARATSGTCCSDQIDAIEPWVEEARRADDIVVFAGHHNWNQLNLANAGADRAP